MDFEDDDMADHAPVTEGQSPKRRRQLPAGKEPSQRRVGESKEQRKDRQKKRGRSTEHDTISDKDRAKRQSRPDPEQVLKYEEKHLKDEHETLELETRYQRRHASWGAPSLPRPLFLALRRMYMKKRHERIHAMSLSVVPKKDKFNSELRLRAEFTVSSEGTLFERMLLVEKPSGTALEDETKLQVFDLAKRERITKERVVWESASKGVNSLEGVAHVLEENAQKREQDAESSINEIFLKIFNSVMKEKGGQPRLVTTNIVRVLFRHFSKVLFSNRTVVESDTTVVHINKDVSVVLSKVLEIRVWSVLKQKEASMWMRMFRKWGSYHNVPITRYSAEVEYEGRSPSEHRRMVQRTSRELDDNLKLVYDEENRKRAVTQDKRPGADRGSGGWDICEHWTKGGSYSGYFDPFEDAERVRGVRNHGNFNDVQTAEPAPTKIYLANSLSQHSGAHAHVCHERVTTDGGVESIVERTLDRIYGRKRDRKAEFCVRKVSRKRDRDQSTLSGFLAKNEVLKNAALKLGVQRAGEGNFRDGKAIPYLNNKDNLKSEIRRVLNMAKQSLRSCVLVVVQGGKVVQFKPVTCSREDGRIDRTQALVGTQHVDHFTHYATMEYYPEKYRVQREEEGMRTPEDIVEESSAWWFNGKMVANQESKRYNSMFGRRQEGWSLSQLDRVYEMLGFAEKQGLLSDCVFVVNKRDQPIQPRNLREDIYLSPKEVETYTGKRPDALSNFSWEYLWGRGKFPVPVASFYTGDDMRDVAMPLPQDWDSAVERSWRQHIYVNHSRMMEVRHPSTKSLVKGHAWTRTHPRDGTARVKERVVFRGGLTGMGVRPTNNLRSRFASAAEVLNAKHNPLGTEGGRRILPELDVGIVGWRWRDVLAPETQVRGESRVIAKLEHVVPSEHRRFWDLKPFETLGEQALRAYAVLDIEGNAATNRLGNLLATKMAVIRHVPSTRHGKNWLFYVHLSDLHKGYQTLEESTFCVGHDPVAFHTPREESKPVEKDEVYLSLARDLPQAHSVDEYTKKGEKGYRFSRKALHPLTIAQYWGELTHAFSLMYLEKQ